MTSSPKGMAPDLEEDWDEHAAIWDGDEHARLFADQAFASLLERVALGPEAWKSLRVLDFGCGTGLLTEKLAPLAREVVAVDVSRSMLGVLRDKDLGNVEIIRADIDDDDVRSAASWLAGFDLIVASCVCATLPQYERTVDLLARALSPGGLFVQWDWLASDVDADEDELTLDRVEAALRGAGLDGVQVDRAFDVDFEGDPVSVLVAVASRGSR